LGLELNEFLNAARNEEHSYKLYNFSAKL
jgi:hypothetical protein